MLKNIKRVAAAALGSPGNNGSDNGRPRKLIKYTLQLITFLS